MDEKDVVIYVHTVALDQKWDVQPNKKRFNRLVKTMAKKARGTSALCPCKAFVEGFVDLADVACPCVEAVKDIEENGICHCGMFVRQEL